MAISSLTAAFASWLAPTFKRHGFKKSAATWRRTSEDTIQVFNIQKSQWGDQFYLNLGIYLRASGTTESPLEFHCQVRTRIESLVEPSERINELLDFKSSIPHAQRQAELVQVVESVAVPWLLGLERLSTVEKLMAKPSRGVWIFEDNCLKEVGS